MDKLKSLTTSSYRSGEVDDPFEATASAVELSVNTSPNMYIASNLEQPLFNNKTGCSVTNISMSTLM